MEFRTLICFIFMEIAMGLTLKKMMQCLMQRRSNATHSYDTSMIDRLLSEPSKYDPLLPPSPSTLEMSYSKTRQQQLSLAGAGVSGDTNQGAQWLDMNKLCVFIESCTAVRDQGRTMISLRGTGARYTQLALEIAQAVEQLELENVPKWPVPPPIFVDNNVMDHKALVSAASRRGAKAWAETRAQEMKLLDGAWARFPRLGALEVWALLPGVPEPQCIFSKVKEKRFPSKDEVIRQIF
jgi:hypothetical protein